MKPAFFLVIVFCCCVTSQAQYESIFHLSNFKKFKGVMRSNAYKPDDDEKKLLEASMKNVYPSDVKREPNAFVDSPIHWIGIVKDVVINDSNNISTVLFTLEQKYWDYIEDYSIQDEVMFLSPHGEGNFYLVVQLELTELQKGKLKDMPGDQMLFFCYGNLMASDSLPAIRASYVKTVDYKFYSTRIFSYKVKRNADGKVVTDKKGNSQWEEFKMLKVAKRGQNK